jgi:hypothetical protein
MKKLVAVLCMTALLAGAANADFPASISFGTNKEGSTLTWQTLGATHRDHPEITTDFTVLNDSAKMRGVYGADSAMYTALTLSAGDKVSFDWYLSNNGNNIPDYYGGNWVGDATFQFKTVFESGSWNLATNRFGSFWNNHSGYDNGAGGYDNGADLSTGLHVEYLFGATEYTLNITSLADPLKSSIAALGYANGGTVADIQCFRVGLWDSEQDVTVSNFVVTPEPTTLILLGLGSLLLRRKQ